MIPITVISLAINLAASDTAHAQQPNYTIETVATGFEHPWGMAFLPDRRMLVTERTGTLNLIEDGATHSIAGTPTVHAQSQGGLLDVAVDPNFADNQWIYLSYSALNDNGRPNTRVARAKLDGRRLAEVTEIFTSNAEGVRSKHFGSRLAFGPEGHLFITHGELGVRDNAQDPSNHAGAILRINPDGSIPTDNPYLDQPGHMPELYSIGNRNPQGLAIHPKTGALWSHEHGPQGGDEINIIEPGRNYGWPTISHGANYVSGTSIGVGSHQPGLEQPVYFWDPSIAPSGMAFYDGDAFPEWQGNLFVGALKYQLLVRLELNGGRITAEQRIVDGDLGRIRDVRQGPDGLIYLLNDQQGGGVFRLVPKT